MKRSSHTLFLDLAIAPEGATARMKEHINKRGKRAFGVLKTTNEYVGIVTEGEFEVWEKQKRAVHAHGRIRARSRGTRIEVRFIVPTWTRLLLGIFFVLYALVALGIATQPPDPSVSIGEMFVAAAGLAVIATLFAFGARSQRAELRAFLERVFEGVARL